MRGINKAIIIGTLGQDPELKHTGSGTAVCSLSVATNERWKDKNTGEQKESTEWHKVVLWQRLAEIAAEYLTKGSQVYLEGRIQTRKWQDKEGQDRYTTEIVASEMQLLGGSKGDTQQQPAQQQAPAPRAAQGGGFDDDVPFSPYMRGSVA